MDPVSSVLFIGRGVGVLTLCLLLRAAPLLADEASLPVSDDELFANNSRLDPEAPLCIFKTSKEGFPIKLCWAHKRDSDAGLPADEKFDFFEPSNNERISAGGAGICTAYTLGVLVPGQGITQQETRTKMHTRYLQEELDYFHETGKSKCFPGAKIVKYEPRKADEEEKKLEEEKKKKVEEEKKKKKEEVARLKRIYPQARGRADKLPTAKPAQPGDNTNPKLTYNNILEATLAPPDPAIKCLKVCFVLDRSGSMVDDVQFVGEQFSVLEKAWAERYPDCVEASVVGMGQNDSDIYASSPLLIKKSAKELGSIFSNFVDNDSGTEPIYDATNDCIQRLGQGLGETPEPEVFKSVVILTDEPGDPIDCSPSVSQVIKRARSSGTELHVIAPPQESNFVSTIFSPDGTRMVTSSFDGTIKVWDANSGKLIAPLTGYGSWINFASFSPDGTRIVVMDSLDDTAKIFDINSGKLIAPLTGHTDWIKSAIFSPDGTRVLTGSFDDTAKIWDANSGKLIATLTGHKGAVFSASFSPNGRRVLTGSPDATAKIWDANSGKLITTLIGHESPILSASFSPDGTQVVTGSNTGTIKIWNTNSGKQIATHTGHKSEIKSVSFSSDSTRVVTSSDDNTAKIWNAKSGKLIATLTGHTDSINSAIFSPDGTQVVTSSDDDTAKIWDAKTGLQIKTITLPKPEKKECHESVFVNGQTRVDESCEVTRFDPKGTSTFSCSRAPVPPPSQQESNRNDPKNLSDPNSQAPDKGTSVLPGK